MTQKQRVNRRTVDLSQYPDLVVIYLGMYVRRPRGILRLLSLGPQIHRAVAAAPDGLLRHEDLIYAVWPPHVGMRQYWRDFDSLEQWARTLPHQAWWQTFLRDPGATGFWHETYSMRGGFESVFDDIRSPIGLLSFAPAVPAQGPMLSARQRLRRE